MPYTAEISRTNPTCFLFLIDQSESMSEILPDTGKTKAEALADASYDAKIERAVIVHVEAFDWNCPQHITPRFTAAEIEPAVAALRSEVEALRAENAALRRIPQSRPGAS